MTRIGPTTPGTTPDKSSDAAQRKQAATQLEAYFLRQMLSEVRSSTDEKSLDGGFAGSTFHEMLDGQLADSMAKAPHGLGLAPMIERDMAKRQGGGASTAPAALAALRSGSSALPAPSGSRLAPVPVLDRVPSLVPGGGAPLTARPVDGVSRSNYGKRIDPIEGDVRVHAGVDLAAPMGEGVRAAGPGVVTRAESAGGYGNLVVVDHGGGLETRYAHLSAIDVKVGQRVNAGTEVGKVGATGRATGPHLHFEVRRDGQPVDPSSVMPGLKGS